MSDPAPVPRRESQSAADAIVLAREAPARLGPLTIEPAMRRVAHDNGQEAFLEPRVMQALVALVRANGQILSRDEMMAQCWSGLLVGEDAINRVMARLRRLSEGPGAGVFRVETITKVGYRLIAEISAAPAVILATAAPAEPLLAVMAFDNLSGDPNMAYFSDGVSEEIQQTVARAADLKVIGRTSSFHYRGADKDLKRVAAELKATHLLDGAVRRSGGRVRISAQLIECAGETTLWSDRFDRDLTDVFALQDEIAAAVAAALKVAFAPAPAPGPIDPEAYDLYLKTRDAAAPLDPAERIAKLRRVVDQAARYAPARAWLAWWQGYYVVNMDHERPYEVDRDCARRDAEMALKLDPQCAVAYAALSWLEPLGHYAAREALLKQALAAAPHDPLALWNMAGFLDQVGRSLDALVYARQSYELEPLDPHAAGYVAGMYFRMGRYDEGQALAEECRQRWPGHWWFITPMIAFAEHERDWPRFEMMVELAKESGLDRTPATRRTITYGYALRDDNREFAQRLVGDIERNLATRGAPRLDWLTAAQAFGLMDELFSAVDRADYLSLINDVGVNPGGDFPLAQIFDLTINRRMIRDIRFVRLCAKLGLCDYWVNSDSWPDCAYQVSYDFKGEARRLVGRKPERTAD